MFISCFRCPAKNGVVSMCRHICTLLMGASFPQEFRSTYKPVNVLSTVAQRSRQLHIALPPSNSSADIPDIVRRRSSSHRLRSSNLYPRQQSRSSSSSSPRTPVPTRQRAASSITPPRAASTASPPITASPTASPSSPSNQASPRASSSYDVATPMAPSTMASSLTTATATSGTSLLPPGPRGPPPLPLYLKKL